MGVRIDIRAAGAERIQAALDKLAARLTAMRGPLEEIGAALEASTALRFEDQSGPDGIAWAPLSSVSRARGREGGVILSDTGRLGDSMTRRADDRQVEVGTNVIYAGTHQFGAARGAFGATAGGGPIPWGDIPARPFIGISAAAEAEIVAILDDWAQRQTAEALS